MIHNILTWTDNFWLIILTWTFCFLLGYCIIGLVLGHLLWLPDYIDAKRNPHIYRKLDPTTSEAYKVALLIGFVWFPLIVLCLYNAVATLFENKGKQDV